MKSLRTYVWTACAAILLSSLASAQQTTLEVRLDDPASQAGAKEGGVQTVTIMVPADTEGEFLATANVTLDSQIEACLDDDGDDCDLAENFRGVDEFGDPIFGCADEIDNDNDGFLDSFDDDCAGVQGWSISIAADPCFNLGRATTNGTLGDLDLNPPGIRDVQGGNFEKTEVINPDNPVNGGTQGAVSAVVLSFTNPIFLPQVGESRVLLLNGRLSHPALAAGDMTDPCVISIVDPSETGLAGSGEPVKTAVTVSGETDIPELCAMAIKLMGETEPEGPSETAYRIALVSPAGVSDEDPDADPVAGEKTATWTAEINVPEAGATTLPVEARVQLISRLEPCVSDPSSCDGTENFSDVDEFGDPIYGCADEIDNDSDGAMDADDSDCNGVQGWSMSVKTDPCFSIARATTNGTAGDLDLNPPGLRDVQGGNFEKTEVIDPGRNDDMQGAVSAVVLSFTNPVILFQDSTSDVLVLNGRIDVSSVTAPGEMTDPCALTLVPTPPGTPGLRGSGEPVKTAVTVAGETQLPNLCSAEIKLMGREGPPPETEFLRGDPNDDGRTNIADGVWIINDLFQGGPPSPCEASVDGNDDGQVDGSDAVYLINYLFLQGPEPPPPFAACGTDPTADALACASNSNCL